LEIETNHLRPRESAPDPMRPSASANALVDGLAKMDGRLHEH